MSDVTLEQAREITTGAKRIAIEHLRNALDAVTVVALYEADAGYAADYRDVIKDIEQNIKHLEA